MAESDTPPWECVTCGTVYDPDPVSVGDDTPTPMERVFLSCSFCGHWEAASRTKEQVAEWLRIHKAATLGVDRHGIDRQSTCPHPCGTPMVPVGDDTDLDPTAPDVHDLIVELRTAVGLFAGAMPITPKQAWDEAVAVAKRAVQERDAYEHADVGVPVGDDTPAPTAGQWTWDIDADRHVTYYLDGVEMATNDVLDALSRAEVAPDLTALRTILTAWSNRVAALVREDTDNG